LQRIGIFKHIIHWNSLTVCRKGNISDRQPLTKLCDVLVEPGDSSLSFLVEVDETKTSLWRLRSRPKRLSFADISPRLSLQESLSAQLLKSLRAKRVLALTFAYGLIQCIGSPYSKQPLQKDSLFFFQIRESIADFERPYFSTRFDGNMINDSSNMSIQHRNPSILQLGILLVEIHKGQPLSTFRLRTEQSRTSSNTDLAVARRVVEELEEWCSEPYKDVIRACLELPWVPAGQKVDLDDEKAWSGFYNHVIKPLEIELEYLFRLTL
jgi:hypothetical protein